MEPKRRSMGHWFQKGLRWFWRDLVLAKKKAVLRVNLAIPGLTSGLSVCILSSQHACAMMPSAYVMRPGFFARAGILLMCLRPRPLELGTESLFFTMYLASGISLKE